MKWMMPELAGMHGDDAPLSAKWAREVFSRMDKEREHIVALPLDKNYKVVGGFVHLADGGRTSVSPPDPNKMFQHLAEKNVKHVVLIHNHPPVLGKDDGGEVTPSANDIFNLFMMRNIGLLYDVDVADAMVIGPNGDYIFVQNMIEQVGKLGFLRDNLFIGRVG